MVEALKLRLRLAALVLWKSAWEWFSLSSGTVGIESCISCIPLPKKKKDRMSLQLMSVTLRARDLPIQDHF